MEYQIQLLCTYMQEIMNSKRNWNGGISRVFSDIRELKAAYQEAVSYTHLNRNDSTEYTDRCEVHNCADDFQTDFVTDVYKRQIMLILASLMLCIFLADILAKGIAGPIERTSKAMQQFAEGDFSVRLPEGRRDEIGAMNSVFNQTIEKIEQLIKQVVDVYKRQCLLYFIKKGT